MVFDGDLRSVNACMSSDHNMLTTSLFARLDVEDDDVDNRGLTSRSGFRSPCVRSMWALTSLLRFRGLASGPGVAVC